VEKERLERELELAREIQQGFLPDCFPRLPGFECAARSVPARHVGGDFYDAFLLDEARVALVVADVSDKGVPAALFMALTRSLIRAEALRDPDPTQVVQHVHELLLEMNRAGLFVTLFYGVMDTAQRKLHYVRAGHDEPLHCSPASSTCCFLKSQGMLLGLVDPVHLEAVRLDLQPGDLLVLYTDGVTDATSPAGEFFGRERLEQTIREAGDRSAQEVCDLLFERIATFQAGAAQYDDTAVLIARLPEPGRPTSPAGQGREPQ
jgi:sigma-B regulation protein RsbU (phosphoserine phosphatase)